MEATNPDQSLQIKPMITTVNDQIKASSLFIVE
jgi:hypothetical protein